MQHSHIDLLYDTMLVCTSRDGFTMGAAAPTDILKTSWYYFFFVTNTILRKVLILPTLINLVPSFIDHILCKDC